MFSNLFPNLTLEMLVRDIPHDAGAWVTYALLGLFVWCVWIGHRNSAKSAVRYGRPTQAGTGGEPVAAAQPLGEAATTVMQPSRTPVGAEHQGAR